MNHKIRKNNGEWRRLQGISDVAYALHQIGPRDTIEIKVECSHDHAYVDNGIRICKTCGEQLEVTSYRD